MKPKVSIIIPCYNAEEWIDQCLRSALSQTYGNVEVIFVDNESTDRSVEVAKAAKEDYPDLIIDSAPNVYPNCWDEGKEKGFSLATGEYAIIMGADDFLDFGFVENCMKYILAAPSKIKAFQSHMHGILNDTGNVVKLSKHSYNSLSEFKEMCLGMCPVNTPTIIYNMELYRDGLLKAQPEKYGGAADYDLYCKLADKGIMIYPGPTWLGYYYRWHPNQATWKVHEEEKDYDSMIQDYWREKWKT